MVVEGVVAGSPCHGALLLGLAATALLVVVGAVLTLQAKVHDMIAADCADVHVYVPAPQCHGVPLFDLEATLLVLTATAGAPFVVMLVGAIGFRDS